MSEDERDEACVATRFESFLIRVRHGDADFCQSSLQLRWTGKVDLPVAHRIPQRTRLYLALSFSLIANRFELGRV